MPGSVQRARTIVSALAPTFRYWMQTEVHVFAFSTAANVLLSFFPFLIVMMSITRLFFNHATTVAAIDAALNDFFPDALGSFLHNNLPDRTHIEWISLLLLLFTANGVFEPLEVALNHVWGVRTNRSFFRNQLISFALIFACGGLGIVSTLIGGLHQAAGPAPIRFTDWLPIMVFKLAAVPIAVVALFLIYYYLPNFRPPAKRVLAAAIIIAVLMEVLKGVNWLVWKQFLFRKVANEYGVFKYSVTLIFLSFVATMLVLAGAEWAARGHRADRDPPQEPSNA